MSELVPLRQGSMVWHVAPVWRHRLLDADGLRLEEWIRDGKAHVVKNGPHRTVYRVELSDAVFYLKHYRLPDLRSWLRQCLRPAKARIEYQSALAVAKKNVPTITPLALGEGSQIPSDSYLLTHDVEGAIPLCDFLMRQLPELPPDRRVRLRQRTARALGQLIGHLHNMGIVHADLHAANLLLRVEPDDNPKLFLIDLHAVGMKAPLSWPASRDNLTLLNRWFVLRACRSDRHRFWLAYWDARAAHSLPAPRKECARTIEEATWVSNKRFWCRRDRRCLGRNRYFYKFDRFGMRGHAVRDLEKRDLDKLLEDPEHVLSRDAVHVLKHSKSSTVVELDLRFGGQVRRVILKKFAVTGTFDSFANLMRDSPAMRSWKAGHGMLQRCLPTARPLAVFHRRQWGLEREGYLLMEKVPSVIDLHQVLPNARENIEQVAHLIATLHERSVSHRDLKAGNILLNEQGFWLIDLVGVHIGTDLTRTRRVRDLARLHVSCMALSRTDKLRFLRAYLRWGLHGKTGWKDWWREIAAATAVKIAKNKRLGRPLA